MRTIKIKQKVSICLPSQQQHVLSLYQVVCVNYLQAAVVGDSIIEYSEVYQSATAEATLRQPTYMNATSKSPVGH